MYIYKCFFHFSYFLLKTICIATDCRSGTTSILFQRESLLAQVETVVQAHQRRRCGLYKPIWHLQGTKASTWRPLLRYIRKENLFFTVWEFGPIVPPIWSDQATTGTSRELVLPPPPALAELSSSSPSVSCNGSISTSSGRICVIQAFWDIIHPQLLSLLQLFHSNGLYVWRLTQASITLLPKKKDANTVEDFRPISIISRFIKIVSKKRNKHCL